MRLLTRPVKAFVRRRLNEKGYYWIRGLGEELCTIEDFRQRAEGIKQRFRQQDKAAVTALRKKYEQPIIGDVSVYRLLELLAQVIDPANNYLYCGSQLTHTLQVLESMERAGINETTNREMIVFGLIHDLGEIALLKGELPEHVEGGGKRPLADYPAGIGLDNCAFTWDHSDIVHARLKNHVSENIAWLLRYHSITPTCVPLMNDRDRMLYERYHRTFIPHDRTYVFYHLPNKQLEDYRGILEEAFPRKISF
jgi:hypothetical protein